MKAIKKYLAAQLWCFCEDWEIPLGKWAPIVFGWAIGCKGVKIEKVDEVEDESTI